MYFPRNWEFRSALSKLRNFGGGGFEHPKPPPRYATDHKPSNHILVVVSSINLLSILSISWRPCSIMPWLCEHFQTFPYTSQLSKYNVVKFMDIATMHRAWSPRGAYKVNLTVYQFRSCSGLAPEKICMYQDRLHTLLFHLETQSLQLFHQPTLMHNFLYSLTTCLLHYYPPHLRALTCPSSGGKIVFTQHLVSSLSVNVCPVHWLGADCSPLSTGALCNRLQRATIADAVWIQIFLLKMGMLILETCRG